ncbi:hypothetical protein BASA81_000153 [Batrachochytrium salamandrivorans]|nr:hypothetical protein BASA81_000153 [Batrachochytrium salamandrivorans]
MDKAAQFAAEDLDRDRQLRDLGYDSDDPRSFGGEFYWGMGDGAQSSIATKLYDLVRFVVFHLYRALGFCGLVVLHFFGFQSRFQWALDLVEKEEMRLEQQALEVTS